MKTILILVAICLPLAWVSERNTQYILEQRGRYRLREDAAFWLLAAVLILFAGHRTEYNDTWNYISGFRRSFGLTYFLSDPENLNPFKNPLFYFFQNLLRNYTYNAQWLILITSAFTQFSMLWFLKRYSRHFTFSVFLYFALGTFNVSLGAIKQLTAMSILIWAFPFLEQRQYGRFYLLVLIAMLFHTYAITFAVLPLFKQRPWTTFTFLFVGVVGFVLMNFQEVIEEFMEQANSLGKTLADYEVFDDQTTNLFRVAVYAATPLFSLFFARWINHDATKTDNLLIHMSIISLAAMSMGTQAGANMFARMAHYFEIGTLVALPNMVDKPFEKYSYRFVITFILIAFAGFFLYANKDFDSMYDGLGILGLFYEG